MKAMSLSAQEHSRSELSRRKEVAVLRSLSYPGAVMEEKRRKQQRRPEKVASGEEEKAW